MSDDLFDTDLDLLSLTQNGYFDIVEQSNAIFGFDFEEEKLFQTFNQIGASELSGHATQPCQESNIDQVQPGTFTVNSTTQSNDSSVVAENNKSKFNAINNPTFLDINDAEKENFIQGMKNKNTIKKTETSLRQFQRWLAEPPRNEYRNIWDIMPAELDNFIGSFLLSIRKADGSEYEPDTLTSYHRGIDRSLRENKYTHSIVSDKEFTTSRQVLASKRKELKGKGKGNRPNAAEPLTANERQILREKGLTGTDSPKKLLNLIWLNNTVLFGLRGSNENRQLRWGDIKLKINDHGREFIEYNERLTKTRTAEKTTEVRAFNPKQFAHETPETCPVNEYKLFAQHRPTEMCQPESPFYLGINHKRLPGSNKWFKSQPLGEHTLSTLMKTMAEECGLQGKKTNHSARKTTCTDLLHSGIAPTTIQQLSAHKNVQSVNNYARASGEMQERMSDILSHNPNPPIFQNTAQIEMGQFQNQSKQSLTNHTTGFPAPGQVSAPGPSTYNPIVQSNIRNMSEIELTSTHTGHILQNARLMNCPITIINKTVKTGDISPPLPKRRRIIPIIESDSDSE